MSRKNQESAKSHFIKIRRKKSSWLLLSSVSMYTDKFRMIEYLSKVLKAFMYLL